MQREDRGGERQGGREGLTDVEVLGIATSTPAALVVRITLPIVGVAMSSRRAGKEAQRKVAL